LKKWLTTNFSEAFEAWIHLKALRVFVESVLRYGLPPNFAAIIFQVRFPHSFSFLIIIVFWVSF